MPSARQTHTVEASDSACVRDVALVSAGSHPLVPCASRAPAALTGRLASQLFSPPLPASCHQVFAERGPTVCQTLLDPWFSSRDGCAPRGHLAMSTDVLVVTTGTEERGATGVWWAEAREVAGQPAVLRTAPRTDPWPQTPLELRVGSPAADPRASPSLLFSSPLGEGRSI